MCRKNMLFLKKLTFISIIFICGVAFSQQTPKIKKDVFQNLPVQQEICSDRVLVKFAPGFKQNLCGVKGAAVNAAGILNINGITLEPVFNQTNCAIPFQSKSIASFDQEFLSQWYSVKVSGKVTTFGVDSQIIEQLKQVYPVEYVEPVYYAKMYSSSRDTIPNDPLFSQQWFLKNASQQYEGIDWNSSTHARIKKQGVAGKDSNVAAAWDLLSGDEKEVVVGLIDSGVDYNHSELSGKISVNSVEDINHNGKFDQGDLNGIDDDHNGYVDDVLGWDFGAVKQDNNPIDENGHGTHCAGIIGAVSGNAEGIAGVCNQVKILPVKIFPQASSDNIAQAISYAVTRGARVLSNSWGFTTPGVYPKVVEEVIAYARQQGAVVIFAAGNDCSNEKYYPAADPKTISVGATDSADKLAWFSNYGYLVDVYAPGVDILSLRAAATAMYGNDKTGHIVNEKYYLSDGTSMSTPLVSGIAAMLLSVYPQLSVEQVEERLVATGDSIIETNQQVSSCLGAAGRINALSVLQGKTKSSLSLLWQDMQLKEKGTNPNGVIEPGEEFTLGVAIKNWGVNATGVKLTFELDANFITLVSNGSCSFGSVGFRQAKDNYLQPAVFKVAEDVNGPVEAILNLKLSVDGQSEETYQLKFTVDKKINLEGVWLQYQKYSANNAWSKESSIPFPIIPKWHSFYSEIYDGYLKTRYTNDKTSPVFFKDKLYVPVENILAGNGQFFSKPGLDVYTSDGKFYGDITFSGANSYISSTPALAYDANGNTYCFVPKVFIGTSGNWVALHVVKDDGQQLTEIGYRDLKGVIPAGVTVAKNKYLFYVEDGSNLFCCEPFSGVPYWNFNSTQFGSTHKNCLNIPAVDEDTLSTVFVNDFLYCLDIQGKLKWRVNLENYNPENSVVIAQGMVFVADGYKLKVFRLSDGVLLASLTNDVLVGGDIVVTDKMLFYGLKDGSLGYAYFTKNNLDNFSFLSKSLISRKTVFPQVSLTAEEKDFYPKFIFGADKYLYLLYKYGYVIGVDTDNINNVAWTFQLTNPQTGQAQENTRIIFGGKAVYLVGKEGSILKLE